MTPAPGSQEGTHPMRSTTVLVSPGPRAEAGPGPRGPGPPAAGGPRRAGAADPAGGGPGHHGAPDRRDRHRQDPAGAAHPRALPAPRRAVPGGRLRLALPEPDRERD